MSRVDALRREREGYVVRNLPARVALVDAELARYASGPAPAPAVVLEDAVETADAPPVVERATAPKAAKRAK